MLKYNETTFIKTANKIHNNKYDYSKIVYKTTKIKVIIICPIHGEFSQTPCSHLQGSECHKCANISSANTRKLTKKQFIQKAKQVHGNKYDYSLVNYINNMVKVKIICPIHGIFEQTPSSHFRSGCKQCGSERTRLSKVMTMEIFLKKANIVHNNKYDYSKTNCINRYTKIKIICPIHGEFEQTFTSHLSGNGCKQCGNDKLCKERIKSNVQFIEKAKQVHGDKYDYSLVQYDGAFKKIKIICPIHGIFEQISSVHYKCGCPTCKESHGEKLIRLFLINNYIHYIRQYKFDDCKGVKYKLPFDFYLPDYNICIEFDGEQHFNRRLPKGNILPIQKFEANKRNDLIKTNYCLSNNIKLIRIPYWNINDINHILFMILFN